MIVILDELLGDLPVVGKKKKSTTVLPAAGQRKCVSASDFNPDFAIS